MLYKHTSDTDLLNREQDITFFTSLIDGIEKPYVLSIEAPWGSGKSFFLKLWEAKLIEKQYTCITFNAWENDFTANPFLSIISEITTAIESKKTNSEELKNKLNTLKSYATPIVKHLLKSTIKIASGISLELDTAIEKTIGDGLADISTSYLDQYQKSKESVSKFKDSLQDFADDIKSSTNKPLLIFIDELDRCRPDYTIELLESIKYYFYSCC